MKATVKTKIGKAEYVFEIEEQKELDILHKIAVLGNPPTICDACDAKDDVELASNKDKEGNIYIKIVCNTCGATAKLGLYKTGGYFWHRFEKWQGRQDN